MHSQQLFVVAACPAGMGIGIWVGIHVPSVCHPHLRLGIFCNAYPEELSASQEGIQGLVAEQRGAILGLPLWRECFQSFGLHAFLESPLLQNPNEACILACSIDTFPQHDLKGQVGRGLRCCVAPFQGNFLLQILELLL